MLLDSIVLRFIPKFPHALLGCLYFRLKCACIVFLKVLHLFSFERVSLFVSHLNSAFKCRIIRFWLYSYVAIELFISPNLFIAYSFHPHPLLLFHTRYIFWPKWSIPYTFLLPKNHMVYSMQASKVFDFSSWIFLFVQIESPHIFSYTIVSILIRLSMVWDQFHYN